MKITSLMPAKMANYIVNMQMEHSLPIEITIGAKADDMVLTTIACSKINDNAVIWVVEKAISDFLKDLPNHP